MLLFLLCHNDEQEKKLPFNGKNSFQFFIGNNTTKRKENQF